MNKLLEWVIKRKGTNLLNYGVLIIFINLIVFKIIDNGNSDIEKLIQYFGSSIAFLGGAGKALAFIYVFDIKVMKYVSILSITIAVFFFLSSTVKFIVQLFGILSS